MSVPNNRVHHYRNLRDRYTNCTYVDGNLELTWLQDESFDLSFLKDIREVSRDRVTNAESNLWTIFEDEN